MADGSFDKYVATLTWYPLYMYLLNTALQTWVILKSNHRSFSLY